MNGCGDSHTSREHDCAAFSGMRYIDDRAGLMASSMIEAQNTITEPVYLLFQVLVCTSIEVLDCIEWTCRKWLNSYRRGKLGEPDGGVVRRHGPMAKR